MEPIQRRGFELFCWSALGRIDMLPLGGGFWIFNSFGLVLRRESIILRLLRNISSSIQPRPAQTPELQTRRLLNFLSPLPTPSSIPILIPVADILVVTCTAVASLLFLTVSEPSTPSKEIHSEASK